MKKLFLTLIAAVACTVSGFAQISLNDAYSSIVNHPGMVEKSIKDVPLNSDASIVNLRSVTCTNPRYAGEFYYTYESLPVVNMLIGANNQNDMACVFTEPSDNGVYNVLVLAGEAGGPYVAAYGQTTAEGLEAIRNSQVTMDSDQLNIAAAAAPTVDVIEFISMEIDE